jgi:hypothetical protein
MAYAYLAWAWFAHAYLYQLELLGASVLVDLNGSGLGLAHGAVSCIE